ncbi:RDD family protein [Geothrix oryzisoli]|uniref:RDD family protein n=1 Tax=Geothrix oryzisoli TaxID=2922721 RepID=UPI001FAC5FB3|nr:RDD family protein [Geothrix oryzisoli]
MDQQGNPYTPPTSMLTEGATLAPLPIELVGSGTRFANFMIDNIICYTLQFSFGAAIVLIFKADGANHLQTGCMGSLYGILITITYYSFMEYKFGFTLGKLVTKTRVVDETGGPISLGKAIGRSFSRYIPFEPFSFFGAESRGWHDSISKTCVVKRSNA